MERKTPKAPLNPADFADATEAWLSVVRTYNNCTATISARIAPLGITLLQHEMLVNLLRTPGLTQQQLAVRCFSAKSGISMLIARFEMDGIIRRRSDPADKRVHLLDLTQNGTAIAQQALQVQLEVIREMATVFEPAELPLLKTRMDEASEILLRMRDG